VVAATSRADGPHAQVTAGFRAYFRFVSEHREAFQLLFLGSSRHDREFARAVEDVEESMADAIAGLIEAGLDQAHRRQLAHALVGMAEVTGRRAGADVGFADDLDALAERLAALAWAGLRGVRPDDGPGPDGGGHR
jgi:AcrR family transcriptional regulator